MILADIPCTLLFDLHPYPSHFLSCIFVFSFVRVFSWIPFQLSVVFIKKRFKGRLVGPFQHFILRLIVLLPPNEFLHSSPEAPRTTQARQTSASEGRNYYQGIYLANTEFTKVLGSSTCRKAGTWDRFFHFPSEGRHSEDYSDTRKIQRLRPGSNPRTRGNFS